MPKKKPEETGPSTFLEWVVGTTVSSATRPRQPKPAPTRRDMIRIELSTDDEDETDSLRLTYPRSARGKPTTFTKSKEKEETKKVRFERVPKKSAMKKTTTTVTEIETDSEGGEESEEDKPAKKGMNKKRADEICNCIECIRERQKAKKCLKKNVSTGESDDSESEASERCKKKQGKKGKKQDSGSEAESSVEESESEPEEKKGKKQKQKGWKKDKAKVPENSDDEEEKTSKKERNKQKDINKPEANSSKKRQQQKDANKKGNYPEGVPSPHPRRPHYIEPIRAEVMQTERVMEGPEDPKPNAYYDAEHNVLRVYHGPVYGGNHGQGLYPKRDPNNRPLPMGSIHPTQNPWLNGFKDDQGGNVPVTQGMPVNAMYAPPGQYGYPPPGAMYPYGPPPVNEGGWNKGAFAHMRGANGPGPGDKAKSASNNVGPGSVKAQSLEGKNNPYYQLANANNPNMRSKFSNWGSQKGSDKNGNNNARGNASPHWGNNSYNGSWKNGNIDISAPWGAGEPAQLSGQQDSFPRDTTRTSRNGGSNKGSNNGGDWNTNTGGDWGQSNNDTSGDWGQNNDGAPADDWNNAAQTNVTDAWNVNSATNDWLAPEASSPKTTAEENNVAPVETMPGSWDSMTTPAWGDLTAAAATGGAVDNEIDNALPVGGW